MAPTVWFELALACIPITSCRLPLKYCASHVLYFFRLRVCTQQAYLFTTCPWCKKLIKKYTGIYQCRLILTKSKTNQKVCRQHAGVQQPTMGSCQGGKQRSASLLSASCVRGTEAATSASRIFRQSLQGRNSFVKRLAPSTLLRGMGSPASPDRSPSKVVVTPSCRGPTHKRHACVSVCVSGVMPGSCGRAMWH